MTRFSDDYCEEDFPGQFDLQEQAMRNAMAGKKGQQVLRDLEQALLALPRKRLIQDALESDGDVCAIGAYAWYKRVQKGDDPETALKSLPIIETDYETADFGTSLGIARSLAWQIAYINDEWSHGTPEQIWQEMLDWVRGEIKL